MGRLCAPFSLILLSMSAAAKCLQCLLAVFNIVLLIFGILVCVSAAYYVQTAQQSSTASSTGIVLAVVGGFMLLLALFGCIGSFFRSRCSLIVYVVLLGLLIIAQLVIGGIAVATADNDEKVRTIGSDIWNGLTASQRLDFQKKYECCGYANGGDRATDPLSCGITFPVGCQKTVTDAVSSTMEASGIYLFIAAGCQLIAGGIALVLVFDENKRKSGFGRGY